MSEIEEELRYYAEKHADHNWHGDRMITWAVGEIDRLRAEVGRLQLERDVCALRIADLETGMATIKRWIDTGQFDAEACRSWIIDHIKGRNLR